ncbi:MAG: amidohydrolase [Clostridiales bacterium]|nr:amidohydrolase [Clostridiales bacterium]
MYADLALVNGKIYSVSGDDKVRRGSCVLVKGDRIFKVCEGDEEQKYIGKATRVIDCKGHTILPGLCDAHCHPSWSTSFFESCQLFDVTGTQENTSRQVIDMYLEKLRGFIKSHENAEIIRAIGWNRAFFSGACKESRWPSRHDIDRVCSDRPVVMESYCQHAIWINTRAIEMAGLDKNTPDVASGEIFREEDGYPSGIFFEMEAQSLIKNNLKNYDYSVEQYKDTIKRFQNEVALPLGITLYNDCFHTENATEAYKELAQEGELKLRVRGVHHFADCKDLSMVDDIEKKIGSCDVGDIFQINTIKIFFEGEFMTMEPYEKKAIEEQNLPEGYCGAEFYDDETAKKATAKALGTGMQVHIHAMGDRAVKQAVDCLEYGQQITGMKNRNVIAHLMMVRDEDIQRIGKNEIICNCQPRWMIYDSDADEFYQEMFGHERTVKIYPNKQFLDAGCVVSYGTDFPVTPPPDPFHGIHCAVTRSVFKGDEKEYSRYKGAVLGPESNPRQDCVTLKDAVKSSTWSGAYQLFLEDVTGSIQEGKSAEIVVIDRDIENTPQEELYNTKVCHTIFKGKAVY